MTPIERGTAAIIADLRRQSETSGCEVDDNGRLAQVDGSFQIGPLVRAVLIAMREPSEAMRKAGGENGGWSDWYDAPEDPPRLATDVYTAMIDAALSE